MSGWVSRKRCWELTWTQALRWHGPTEGDLLEHVIAVHARPAGLVAVRSGDAWVTLSGEGIGPGDDTYKFLRELLRRPC